MTLVDGDKRKMNIALALLMTYVGTPCIYYGSEVGLEGGLDPDNRRCFPWNEIENSAWLSIYKQWISIRKQYKSLQSGSIQWLHCDTNELAYARVLGSEAIVVVMNLSGDECSIDLPLWQLGLEATHLSPLLDGRELIDYKGHLSVNIPTQSFKLWQLK
nr:alpha-glucosidase C-terminal domain-containing protein [Vibrio diabolicus]